MENDADTRGMLLLNRLLWEGKGSEFIDALADFVLVKETQIDQASLQRLVQAADTVRKK